MTSTEPGDPTPAAPGDEAAPQPPAQWPQPTHPAYPGQPIRTNLLAIIGFVGVFLMPVIGIVLGIMAKRQIAVTGEAGEGLAKWAYILGVLGTILQGIFFVVWIALFLQFTSMASTGP
ncbi:DUF4190 domain-containing protein [Schumannella soli]|uniref:DUF4190 domain-containing protein n=1 Tax=Schumannella soli TaxID=2590779 RepID=A0A506Y466_9MICO|nr:DUF4190 domain-containing protein [Schumannella soli]TPW75808.1 DUF4190 domain-containing protein [Schumannella soli]